MTEINQGIPPPPRPSNSHLLVFFFFLLAIIYYWNAGASAKFIDHSKFYQWVNKLDDAAGFDKHSIFYDSNAPDEYDTPQKEDDQLVLPYLSKAVAAAVLCIVGVISK